MSRFRPSHALVLGAVALGCGCERELDRLEPAVTEAWTTALAESAARVRRPAPAAAEPAPARSDASTDEAPRLAYEEVDRWAEAWERIVASARGEGLTPQAPAPPLPEDAEEEVDEADEDETGGAAPLADDTAVDEAPVAGVETPNAGVEAPMAAEDEELSAMQQRIDELERQSAVLQEELAERERRAEEASSATTALTLWTAVVLQRIRLGQIALLLHQQGLLDARGSQPSAVPGTAPFGGVPGSNAQQPFGGVEGSNVQQPFGGVEGSNTQQPFGGVEGSNTQQPFGER